MEATADSDSAAMFISAPMALATCGTNSVSLMQPQSRERISGSDPTIVLDMPFCAAQLRRTPAEDATISWCSSV